MSALPLASPRPQRAPTPRRHLEVAPTRERRARPRLLPAIVTIAGLGAILLGQLLLSIALAEGAYRIWDLQVTQRDLQRQEQALTEQLEVLSSTQNLTANAEQLGMVASGNPVFLDLSTGAVSGNPTAAGGSLTGSSGNQIGNSLLAAAMLVDAAPSAGGSVSTFQRSVTQQLTEGDTPASASGTIPSPITH